MKPNCIGCFYEKDCPFEGDCAGFDAPHKLTTKDKLWVYGTFIILGGAVILSFCLLFIKIFK